MLSVCGLPWRLWFVFSYFASSWNSLSRWWNALAFKQVVPRRASPPERQDPGLSVASSCCQTSFFTVHSKILSQSPRQLLDRVDMSVSYLTAHGFFCSQAWLSTCLTLPSMQSNLVPPPCLQTLPGPWLSLVSVICDVPARTGRPAQPASPVPGGLGFLGDDSVTSVCTDPFCRDFGGSSSTREGRGGPSLAQNRAYFLGSDVFMWKHLGYG